MPPKRKRTEQVLLGERIDREGCEMPVPCSSCLLLASKGEPVECRMDVKSSSRCGECARRGRTACDGGGLDAADCMFCSCRLLLLLMFDSS